jgi:branched-chain amino acid transport system ATP-binding protein
MLEITNLHAAYGPIAALKGVDITVNTGEIVALIGANGAGKSTLLMTICGKPRAQAGRIVYDGVDITFDSMRAIVHRGIAHAPEGRRIFARLSVLENLHLGATIDGEAHVAEDAERMFELFPILGTRRDQRGGTLSGGEQQMLAIARALMARPKLLLLDEPSLGLAPLITKRIFEVIRDLNRTQGLTVLLVEQNAHQALKVAARGYVLQTGSIVLAGTGAELLANEDVRAAYLGSGATT